MVLRNREKGGERRYRRRTEQLEEGSEEREEEETQHKGQRAEGWKVTLICTCPGLINVFSFGC